MDYQNFLSERAAKARRSEIREILKLTRKPEIISFAGGLPAPDTFPTELLSDICDIVLREQGTSALQYGLTGGEVSLREQIAKWVAKDGIEVGVDNVFITNGSQQGLDLIGRVFIDPGDTIIAELPTYIGGLQAFRSYFANIEGVAQDDGGMRVDLLEAKLKELAGKGITPKFIYVVPDFQNPSGVTMMRDRREKLIALASEYNTLIVEDTPYRELRFSGEDQTPLYSMDTDGRVITLTTFSKIFCPGFRIAWLLAAPELIDKLVMAKQSTDLCCPAFNQLVVAEFMAQGMLKTQVAAIREKYAHNCEVMLAAMDENLPDDISWTKPEGGLFLWVRLPENMDALQLLTDFAIPRNVAYVIGSAFHSDGGGTNTMRINFSYASIEQIKEGVKRLAEAIEEYRATL